MKWLVCDSLSTPEQFFCSHLDSYSHYLREAGEEIGTVNLSFKFSDGRPPVDHPEVVVFLDRYEKANLGVARLKIAQVAAVCSPMPWDVRKDDGSPTYDLVLSSIPWMVEEARAHGCRAEFMPLAFDTRALVCGMGVKERDIPCLFVGSRGPNHRRREEILTALGDLVTIAPPTFGREYFKLLARARSVVNIHAEWARGVANNMRMYEAAGMGATVVTDGAFVDDGVSFGWGGDDMDADAFREDIQRAIQSDEIVGREDQVAVLQKHTYVQRIPQLLELARSL